MTSFYEVMHGMPSISPKKIKNYTEAETYIYIDLNFFLC
jgi:hypothetical protein